MDTTSHQNLNDDSLSTWLDRCLRSRHTVGYLHAEYVCAVVDLSDPSTLYPADPENKSRTTLKKLARKGLLLHFELPLDTLQTANACNPKWNLERATADNIAVLVTERLGFLGRISGRGEDIDRKTAWQVWVDAGGRCMFEGCGKDLSSVPLYNNTARVGYLAHIIASDPRGPRGDSVLSHQLSNKADNIMLMCDEHHRLIDCFAPAEYPGARLNAIRQEHRDLVRRYLDSLAFPRVKAVTLHANLANIPTYFRDSELIDAILATGRAMLPNVAHFIRRDQRDDRRTPEFWVQYLHEHEHQIRELVTSFRDPGNANTPELAVFPLHHIATMVLAGRIVGEARAVRVFQYHRQRRTWQWDSAATPQPVGTFWVEGLTPDRANEALVTIELTASIDECAIPTCLSDAVRASQLPWVRIRTPNPDFSCIRHSGDLDQFMSVARQAINYVQDAMRVHRVHLIAISPASTVFCFGQMLQAGHHPTYTIYDRAGRDTPFIEAFSISGNEVTAHAGSRTATISIR